MNKKSVSFWNPANLITISRIISVPFSNAFLYFGILPTLTFFLKFGEALSDLADGKVARWFGYETEAGAKLDPMADKLSVVSSSVFIGLVNLGYLSYLARPYPAIDLRLIAILILLEAILLLMGLIASKFGYPVKSNFAGQLKMVSECLFINFWFLSYLSPMGIIFNPAEASIKVNQIIKLSILFASLSIVFHSARYIMIALKKSRD